VPRIFSLFPISHPVSHPRAVSTQGKSYFFGLSAVSGAGEGEILVGREYTDAKEALRLRPGEKRYDDLLYAISSGAKN
jgi:hypothetical protein